MNSRILYILSFISFCISLLALLFVFALNDLSLGNVNFLNAAVFRASQFEEVSGNVLLLGIGIIFVVVFSIGALILNKSKTKHF